MTKKDFSIYVHIPFCVSKCKYCAFYSEKYSKDVAEKYVKALKSTASYFAQKYAGSATVKTIYFGGGTPTSIGAELLCNILTHLKETFSVSEQCEITVEANPKTVNLNDAILLKKHGFNRISLGVQTTDNQRLESLGRIHTWEDAKGAYNIFKSAGFENVSVDLMYALPSQGLNDVLNDVENLLSLEPFHISTYALSVEEGTPLFANKEKYVFPDDNTQAEYYETICKILSQRGYYHYEISNFAKKGFESKHNLGYWERRDYIGIGAGAHSLWDNMRFASPDDRTAFIELAQCEEFDSALGMNEPLFLSASDVKEECIMLNLRTQKGVYIPKLSKKLEELIDGGFAKYENGMFSLTDKGFFVSNTIIYYVCKELLYDE